MEEKKGINLSTLFLILAIIVIAIMAYFMYKINNEKNNEINKVADLNNQVSSLENTVSSLQGKIDTISNTINTDENISDNNTQQSSSVSYIVLRIEDTEAHELKYKDKKITDTQKIKELMKIIDSATPYKENSFIADLGDAPPCATIYLNSGEKYTIAAGDQIEDNGKTVNLMTKWTDDDGSDKSLFKVDTKLGEYIETLFNN